MSSELEISAQRDFEMTQGVRRGIVTEVLKKGPVPASKEDSALLLQAMRDMDAQNISRMRIKVEEKQADNTAAAAAMVSAVLREINPRDFVATNAAVNVQAREIPADVAQQFQTVPGEMEISPAQENINEFMARMRS